MFNNSEILLLDLKRTILCRLSHGCCPVMTQLKPTVFVCRAVFMMNLDFNTFAVIKDLTTFCYRVCCRAYSEYLSINYFWIWNTSSSRWSFSKTVLNLTAWTVKKNCATYSVSRSLKWYYELCLTCTENWRTVDFDLNFCEWAFSILKSYIDFAGKSS